MTLLVNLAIQIELFSVLAISFNLLLGFSGQFAMSQAAFYGIGAYVAALAAIHWQLNMFLATALGMGAAGMVGFILGAAATRVSGIYLVVVTLGFQIIASGFFSNLEITGASAGLSGIPLFSVAGVEIAPDWQMVLLCALFVLFAALISRRVITSPFGLVLKAMRDDELATNAVGKATRQAKLLIFVLSAMMAAMAGGLLGGYSAYISPDMFNLNASVLILTVLVLGGIGSTAGSVLGATILVGLPLLLTFLPVPITTGAYLQQVIYGLMVLAFLMLRPQGLIGSRQAVTESSFEMEYGAGAVTGEPGRGAMESPSPEE